MLKVWLNSCMSWSAIMELPGFIYLTREESLSIRCLYIPVYSELKHVSYIVYTHEFLCYLVYAQVFFINVISCTPKNFFYKFFFVYVCPKIAIYFSGLLQIL